MSRGRLEGVPKLLLCTLVLAVVGAAFAVREGAGVSYGSEGEALTPSRSTNELRGHVYVRYSQHNLVAEQAQLEGGQDRGTVAFSIVESQWTIDNDGVLRTAETRRTDVNRGIVLDHVLVNNQTAETITYDPASGQILQRRTHRPLHLADAILASIGFLEGERPGLSFQQAPGGQYERVLDGPFREQVLNANAPLAERGIELINEDKGNVVLRRDEFVLRQGEEATLSWQRGLALMPRAPGTVGAPR